MGSIPWSESGVRLETKRFTLKDRADANFFPDLENSLIRTASRLGGQVAFTKSLRRGHDPAQRLDAVDIPSKDNDFLSSAADLRRTRTGRRATHLGANMSTIAPP
jgi:hypothetical protein